MNTRIRYVKDLSGNLTTKDPLLIAGDLLKVTLVPSELRYVIVNSTNGQLVHTDNAVSLQMLKIKVKKELRSRGAVFNDEIRTRNLQ